MPCSKSNLPTNVKDTAKKESWSDAQIETFVKTANAVLAESGDEGEVIATGIKAARNNEKTNAKQFGKVFFCRHMVQGVAGYQDENIFVSNDTIRGMCKSFEGKPVYIDHQETDLENLQDADGFVVRSFYNENDGWFWAEIMAVSDEAHEAISKGWMVSNAYIPTKWGSGGTYLNVPYDGEVLGGEFTHLAIVPNPRYEDATIMTQEEYKTYNAEKTVQNGELKNSKEKETKKGKIMFWKKTEVKNSDGLDVENTFLTLENGQDVSIAEMVNAIEKGDEDKEEKTNEEDVMGQKIKVNGEEMTVEELKQKYTSKKNAEDEAEKEEEAKNAAKEEENRKNKEDEEKNNSKHFDEMKKGYENSKSKAQPAPVITMADRLEAGKSRY